MPTALTWLSVWPLCQLLSFVSMCLSFQVFLMKGQCVPKTFLQETPNNGRESYFPATVLLCWGSGGLSFGTGWCFEHPRPWRRWKGSKGHRRKNEENCTNKESYCWIWLLKKAGEMGSYAGQWLPQLLCAIFLIIKAALCGNSWHLLVMLEMATISNALQPVWKAPQCKGPVCCQQLGSVRNVYSWF